MLKILFAIFQYRYYYYFINNFGIYKNIYRILKIFYLILIYLNYIERKKFINIFILVLKPHDT